MIAKTRHQMEYIWAQKRKRNRARMKISESFIVTILALTYSMIQHCHSVECSQCDHKQTISNSTGQTSA